MRDQVAMAEGVVDPRRWYVVNTHPGQERLAQRCVLTELFGLEQDKAQEEADEAFFARGAEHVWLPQCVVRREQRKIRIVHKGPLFPTYLFVRFDVESFRWRAIDERFGVSRVLCNGDKPLAVPTSEIEHLQRLVAADGGALIIDVGCKRPKFHKDDLVRITGGSYQGLVGLYVAEVKDRITLLLDILGRTVRHDVSEALVVPA